MRKRQQSAIKISGIQQVPEINQSAQSDSYWQDLIQSPLQLKSCIFGWIAIIYQVIIAILYGLFVDMSSPSTSSSDIYLPFLLAVMALSGYNLMNIYVDKMTFGAMAFNLLLFAMTIQQWFFARQFWWSTGISTQNMGSKFGQYSTKTFELANSLNDRQSSDLLRSDSLSDAIACAISMLIASTAIIGKVGLLEIFILGLFGPFVYQINSMLFFRLFITDGGYGMRVYLFGSSLGITLSILLQIFSSRNIHQNYKTFYFNRTYTFFGALIVWILFPTLTLIELYHTKTFNSNDAQIFTVAAFNVWLALTASVVGAFSATAIINGKLSVDDIIYSILTGGIAFSSSADMLFNPAFAIGIGGVVGFLSCCLITLFQSPLRNLLGLIDPYGTIFTFFVPSLIAGFISAIIHLFPFTFGLYPINAHPGRNIGENLAIQLLGVVLTLGFAIVFGLIMGAVFRILKSSDVPPFDDRKYFTAVNEQQQQKKQN